MAIPASRGGSAQLSMAHRRSSDYTNMRNIGRRWSSRFRSVRTNDIEQHDRVDSPDASAADVLHQGALFRRCAVCWRCPRHRCRRHAVRPLTAKADFVTAALASAVCSRVIGVDQFAVHQLLCWQRQRCMRSRVSTASGPCAMQNLMRQRREVNGRIAEQDTRTEGQTILKLGHVQYLKAGLASCAAL